MFESLIYKNVKRKDKNRKALEDRQPVVKENLHTTSFYPKTGEDIGE